MTTRRKPTPGEPDTDSDAGTDQPDPSQDRPAVADGDTDAPSTAADPVEPDAHTELSGSSPAGPVTGYRMVRDDEQQPPPRCGGHVLTERGWVLDNRGPS